MMTEAPIERACPLPFAVIDISMRLLVKGATVNCWNTNKSVQPPYIVYIYIHTHVRKYIGAHVQVNIIKRDITSSIIFYIYMAFG